jgi:hypothetical protein
VARREDLYQLELSAKADAKFCAEVAKRPHLRVLFLRGPVGDGAMVELAKSQSIYVLAAGPGSTPQNLGELQPMKSLRLLNLEGCKHGDELIEPLSALTQLRHINLVSTRVTKEGAAKLQAALPRASILHPELPPSEAEVAALEWAFKHGNVAASNHKNEGMRSASGEPFWVYLISLDLKGSPPALHRLKELPPSPKRLNIGNLRDADREIAQIVELPLLEYLNLDKADLTSKGMEEIAKAQEIDQLRFKAIDTLPDDAWQHLADESMKHLARVTTLQHLDLERPAGLTSAGVSHLRSLPRLRILRLQTPAIDDRAVEHLCAMPSLRFLWLYDTAVTAQGVQQIAKALPKCVIFWNGPTIIPGVEEQSKGFALEFNGKDSYVDLPTLKYDGSHPITIEATIIPYQVAKRSAVITNGRGNVGMGILAPGGQGNASAHGIFFAGTDKGHSTPYTRNPLTPKQQIHIAAVLEGRTARLFIDGKLQLTDELRSDYQPGMDAFILGDGRTWGQAFHGTIDEVRVSKIARYKTDFDPPGRFVNDADTVALYHCDEGSGDVLVDSSGNMLHGKIVGAKWAPGIAPGPPVPTGHSLEFEGGYRFVDLPTLRYDGSHPVTLEATIQPFQVVKGGIVLGDWSEGRVKQGIALRFPEGQGPTAYGTFIAGCATRAAWTPTRSALIPQRTIHVAGVLDGKLARLYVDGKLQSEQALPGDYKPSEHSWMIGAPPPSRPLAQEFIGQIDEVRVSRTARYKADFTPPGRFVNDADTIALYHCDEGSGDVLNDSSGNKHHGKLVNVKWGPGIVTGPSPTTTQKNSQ